MNRLVLQIKTECSGPAWRNVMTFDAERAPEVADAAAMLSRAAGGLNLAILDGDEGIRLVLNERGAFGQERM